MTRHNKLKSRLRAATRGAMMGPMRGGMVGVSLLELLIAMAILGIIVSVAIPSMSEFGSNQRLVSSAEQIFGHLQQARSESVARGADVFVNFSAAGTTTWTYGVGLATGCDLTKTDPTATGACYIVVNDGDSTVDGVAGATDTGDRVLMRFSSSDYTDVKMTLADFSDGAQIIFDPARGTSSSAKINLESSNGRKLRVAITRLGRSEICSPDGSVSSYGTC